MLLSIADMKIYKIHFEEGTESDAQIKESEEIDDLKEFAELMSEPFVSLLKRRVFARKSKNYDKNLLTKEIGVVD
ncbi:MAG: hypothetical protein LBD76_06060 [Prevotellaceae bacterium]|jgi:hypothetical protein|nr:hypothetical protein [Prevotellaceae bacterium]